MAARRIFQLGRLSGIVLTRRKPLPYLGYYYKQVTLEPVKTLWTSPILHTAESDNMIVKTKAGKEFDLRSEDSQRRIGYFCETLGCEEEEVVRLFSKYPRLLSMKESKVQSVLKLFQENDIAKEEVFTYPEIFTYSLQNLQERIKLLKEGGVESLKIVKVKDDQKEFDKKLTKIKSQAHLVKTYGTKAKMVAEKFQCSEPEAERFLDSAQAVSFVKLETKLDCILNDLLLPPEYVLKHPWVLAYPATSLSKRCEQIKEAGFTYENCDVFLHLLTVEKRHFEKRLEQHKVEREILGSCKNLTEYLCLRLDCKLKDVEQMEEKYSRLLSVNVPKIKQHLDVLLVELKLPASDVVLYPRVLSFATETIEERYNLLLEKGSLEEITVHNLAKSGKSFKQLF